MFRNALEPWHLVLLVLVVVVVFGSKKLPDMARSLGKSARILKSEAKAMKREGTQESTASEQSTEGQVAEGQFADGQPAPRRTIPSVPGDVADSRPVGAPTDATGGR